VARIYIDDKTYDIDGILFDKDGTLIDFGSLWIDGSREVIRHISREVSTTNMIEEKLASSIGFDWNSGNWDVKGPLAIGTGNDLIAVLAHQLYQLNFAWNDAYALVAKVLLKANEKSDWKGSVKEVPGLSSFLDLCQKHQLKLGVVTSDDHANAVEHLQSLEIDHYFSSIIGGDQVSYGKPFAESGEKACAEMGLNPKRCIVIGDSDGDMILGNNIGAKANIGIIQPSNETSHFHHADHLIHTYESILLKD